MKHALLRAAGRRYVAGPAAADALSLARRLAVPVVVCYWDGPDEPPDRVERENAAALEALAASGLDVYLSLKPPSLGPEAIQRLAALAREAGVRIHLDALAPEHAERTLALAEETGAGVTLPSRWRRSAADLERALAAGLHVRVVRGQWPDPEDDDRGPSRFLALASRLRGGAVATHDAALARAALAAADGAELELLYRLPRVEAPGTRARIYLPYGHPWLPVPPRGLRDVPRVAWWLARDTARGVNAAGRV